MHRALLRALPISYSIPRSTSTHTTSRLPTLSRPIMNYAYISNADLAAQLRAPAARANAIAIVDVRDDDHVGGHIRGSQWVPSSSLDHRLPELVRTLQDREMVVFHCTLSQVRGPKAARRYAEERERMLAPEKGSAGEGGTGGEAEAKEQKVYVLRGGFEKWALEGYGPDPELTEAFAKDIWQLEDWHGQHAR